MQTLAAECACTCVSPAGGLGLPPNTEVMRRMKVDLPQPAEKDVSVYMLGALETAQNLQALDLPESAASPMTIVLLSAAALTTTTEDPRL